MWRRFSEEERQTIWDMREAGVPVKRIAKHLGRQNVSLRKFIADAAENDRRLGSAQSCGYPSKSARRSRGAWRQVTPSVPWPRPLADRPRPYAGRSTPTAGRRKYRALVADRAASRNALRPKRAKLAECRRLRGVVERKLEARWSPQQISAWLALEYPDRPEMQVSHETIYQSLFVQSRGALRKELHSCLRSGRAMRRAKAYRRATSARASCATW